MVGRREESGEGERTQHRARKYQVHGVEAVLAFYDDGRLNFAENKTSSLRAHMLNVNNRVKIITNVYV